MIGRLLCSCFLFGGVLNVVSLGISNATAVPSKAVVFRPGKSGPSGPQGPPGPPGNCTCDEQYTNTLDQEYEELRDRVARIRRVNPAIYCGLGMRDGSIPDENITVSTHSNRKGFARLDSTNEGWYPSSNAATQVGREWIMVDIGRVRKVTGVVTQGRSNAGHWTKTYKVEHSSDGRKFYDITKSDKSEKIFNGNTDYQNEVIRRFPHPVEARFVRIYPMSFQVSAFLRFDLIDC